MTETYQAMQLAYHFRAWQKWIVYALKIILKRINLQVQ
jgi:hypothetical protein